MHAVAILDALRTKFLTLTVSAQVVPIITCGSTRQTPVFRARSVSWLLSGLARVSAFALRGRERFLREPHTRTAVTHTYAQLPCTPCGSSMCQIPREEDTTQGGGWCAVRVEGLANKVTASAGSNVTQSGARTHPTALRVAVNQNRQVLTGFVTACLHHDRKAAHICAQPSLERRLLVALASRTTSSALGCG